MTRIHAKQIAVLACAALLTVASSAHAGKPKFFSRGNGGGNSSSSQGGSMSFSGNGLSSRIKQSGGFQVLQKQQTQVQQNNLHGLGIHLNKGNKNGNSNGIGNAIGNGIGNGNLKKHLPQINIGIGNGSSSQFGIGGGNSAQFKTKSFWCQTQPKHCWWWYDYCPNYCVHHPTHYHVCNYYYLPISAQYQWYLGVKGMVLPNKGFAINEVDAFSPAALAGIQPGMVITRCNGIDLVSEQAVGLALAAPNGLLQMEVFVEGAAAPVPVTIQMRAVPVVVH
jgi:hypothetical protein